MQVMMLSRNRPNKNIYSIEDLAAAKKILLLLDGYRKLNIEDFGWADKEVTQGKMGGGFASEWREIRKLLLKFARIAGSQRQLLKLANYQQGARQVGLIISSISMVLVSMGAISAMFGYAWGRNIPAILGYTVWPLLIGLTLTLFGPVFIARKISIALERMFERKRDFVQEADLTLKNVCQRIIYSIVEYLKSGKKEDVTRKKGIFEHFKRGNKEKTEKKKRLFAVFHLDYAKIQVVKKPYLFRKYYMVNPVLDENSEHI
jgi:hypothetical protein